MTRFFLYVVLISFLVVGCKAKNILPTDSEIDTSLKSEQILDLHQASFPKFQSLSGAISVSFDNGKEQQSLPFTFRMKTNEAIWLSAPLGIAKAFLTPEKIQFYNKLDNTFYDGDYSLIGELIGVELDYKMVENLLLGQLVLQSHRYKVFTKDDGYVCFAQNTGLFNVDSVINSHFRVSETILEKPNEFKIETNYTYQNVGNQLFPNEINIKSRSEGNNTNINIRFSGIELDKQFNFPFKIPSECKPLTIKK